MESREDKSLLQNSIFFLKFYTFYTFISNLWIFIKINICSNKFGPIWAHKGPYGPQPGLGPNPARAKVPGIPRPRVRNWMLQARQVLAGPHPMGIGRAMHMWAKSFALFFQRFHQILLYEIVCHNVYLYIHNLLLNHLYML